MNCQDIRGDIDLCALGTLPTAEAQRVRTHAAMCESCRAELLAAEDSAAQLALTAPRVHAPAALREAVFAAVQEEAPQDGRRRRVVAARRILARSRRLTARYGAAAVALVAAPLAALVVWTALLQRQVNDLRHDTAEMQRRNDDIVLIASPSVKADFAAVGDTPTAAGSATWNPELRVCFVFFDNLPRPEPGTTYRLWYVTESGRRVDAGEVLVDEGGRAEVILDATRWRAQQYEMTLRLEHRPHDPNAPAVLAARLRRP